MKAYLFVIGIFLFKDAYAYLDPGSGNALVCLFLSLIGAFFYYLKSFFYKIVCKLKGKESVKQQNEQIALFSEGKNYWYTYKPIISELIGNKIPFIYYTMDVEDPALLIDNEYMHSKYIGSSNRAYAKVGSLKTKILLTTTPNIGCPEYPLRRPTKVEKLCHVWHSISDSSVYHLGALDHYDVALTVGEWVETPLRQVEKIRKLNKKEIIPVGLPYFDELKKKHDELIEINQASDNDSLSSDNLNNKVILVAPSWGAKSCLRVYGTNFIKDALEQGFRVIYRPHPQSIKVENNFVQDVCSTFKSYKNFSFDSNPDASESMIKSDMMISDKSGVRFDYAFLYEKPVLTLDFPSDLLDEYEAVLLGRVWGEKESELIGSRLQPTDKEKIIATIKQTLEFKGNEIKKFREAVLTNYGSSAAHIVHWMNSVLAH